MSTRGGAEAASPSVPHGTLGGYTNHDCRCTACSAAHLAYQRGYTARRGRISQKARTKEPQREPLANIVILPGTPTSQCPQCLYASDGTRSFLLWPAVERRGRRWVYGCERGHRWFADGAHGRP